MSGRDGVGDGGEDEAVEKLSLLRPMGYSDSRCGYCGRSNGSRTYYASSNRMTPQFYQDMICRGWRRSGTTLYKPDLLHSCCPQYTIRLDTNNFKAGKDQRQCVNRFNRYILGEEYEKAMKKRPMTKEEAQRRKQEWHLSERVHEAETSTLTSKEDDPKPEHRFQVSLEPDNFTEEKYALFENYQRIVHKEPPSRISRSGFRSFLCTSPLQRSTQKSTKDGKEIVKKIGTYHQCYRLDGKLVAIGVLDLLPSAVSAVYFMYHESLHSWSPGKLSALREAALAVDGGYRYYMMGFYIRSCVKMRYKGDFKPQYVLDPESYEWNPLDGELGVEMDKRGYVSPFRDRKTGKSNSTIEDGAAKDTEDQNGDTTIKVPNDIAMQDDSDDETEVEDMPLYARNIPGILSKAELEAVDLGSVKLMVRGDLHSAHDLVVWDSSSLDDTTSIKCVIGDLVSAIGPELAERMAISFG